MNKRKWKTILIAQLLLIILIEATILVMPKIKNKIYLQEIENKNQQTLEEVAVVAEKPTQTHSNKKLLDVPFICQAPLQTEENWTLHEESCEEAALLQAYLYETKTEITKEEANRIILDMIEWQVRNFGGHYDIYAQELKEFAINYYQIPENQIKIIFDATINDIKKEIDKGRPVIVPITGEILKNPYYPYPGYHMLIAIGYTEDRIITNDNGTRKGAGFSYDIDVFEEAMRDAGGDIVILELNNN